jgi:Prokaryotic N-terminal methylation motif
MIWICPTRIDRPHGALPHLRGRLGRNLSGVPRPCRAIARRRRKQGSAPLRSQSAFSLVEVLASLFILTLSAVGITAAWRLADYQELLTRADRRAERILRQYYELQTFAPADSRPFTVNASASPSPSPITGYLYFPRLVAGQSGSGQFGKMIPFSISMTNGTAGTQLF